MKEGLRRKEREDFFMEGVRLAKEQGEKKTKMSSIKQRKLAVRIRVLLLNRFI